ENAGLSRALSAAAAVGNASVVFPRFADRGDRKLSDFNDLHVEQSLDDVRVQVQAAIDAALSPAPAVDSGKPALKVVDSPPPSAGESGQNGAEPVADAGGRGGKRKPKKEYGQDHWDTVDYLLNNFTLIYGDDAVWDADNRIILKVACMRLAFGTDAVKFWLNNPGRKMVPRDGVVFDPTFSADPACTVNLYDGIKTVPKKGDCSLIKKLLLHLCDGNAEVAAWVLRWLAFPLQNPGAKMRSSIIVHGDEGSGKNLFFESAVAKIYGEYGGVIGNAQIESQFNEWASKKLYMVADEVVTRTELRQLKGKLKALVTGETVRINPKNLSERDEANHMNFVFLSNELQPLALDRSDRRYLVLWTPPKLDEVFYAAVGEQVRNGGVEAFYHYLLHEVPLDGFNEHTKPPVNEAKEDLIALGLSPAERFYREWRGGFLPLPYVCCSAEQLYSAFTRWCNIAGERYPPSQTFFGRVITREGRADGVRKHVAQYPLGNAVKQRTVYLVGNQPEDKSQTDWIAGASELFEVDLRKFRSGSTGNSESEY
ncbi:MAG: traC, partial [Burkholderiaceae bacterium]|nr:traC [Burkholderiaceae bacterium]